MNKQLPVLVLFLLASVHGHSIRGGDHYQHTHSHLAEEHHEHHHHHEHDHHGHHDHRHLGDHDHSRCGTADMTQEDENAQRRAMNWSKRQSESSNRRLTRTMKRPTRVVPVCFHVIGSFVTRWQLDANLKAMNEAFGRSCCDPSLDWCNGECSDAATDFHFVMAGSFWGNLLPFTVPQPSSWFSCVNYSGRQVDMNDKAVEYSVKKQMRKGDGEVLNVYISDLGAGKLGYAYYPNILLSESPELDGVVVHSGSLVGGSFRNYNEGDTLAHEVGHWLG